MPHHVHEILLVSSLYDSFTLSEDGKLSDLIMSEFLDMNLRHTPGVTQVSTGREALQLARANPRFNLIITSLQVGDMDSLELARRVKELRLNIPVILLAYDNRELTQFMAANDTSDLERAFLWQGNAKILLGIVKYVEDRLNLSHDTGEIGVPAIIVVEDNVRYYSAFLPMLFTELMNHARDLIPDGLNLAHKIRRIRARPKILLCSTYEEAVSFFDRYPDDILGVISDIEFPRNGKLSHTAGGDLARHVRSIREDVPVILQSSLTKNQELADEVGSSFLLKGSPLMLNQLRRTLQHDLGFGDFSFRMPDGREIGRAGNLRSLAQQIREAPDDSMVFHGEHNHFSRWLKVRTEFALAEQLRAVRISDFPSVGAMRDYLAGVIDVYRRERNQGVVVDFKRENYDASAQFYRIGGGSLGGKARGLAFINHLLAEFKAADRFPGVTITVPDTVVLGSDVFDTFLDRNNLRDFAISCDDQDEIMETFHRSPFPEDTLLDLATYLKAADYPLAVRSSSLLEDSQYQPFAGVYETYMLPNRGTDLNHRLEQLVSAIKRVYASTYSIHTKRYIKATPYRLEEEKMAVAIQRIIGDHHGSRFYPHFSGVARSHNYYPAEPCTTEDGVAAVALGLGETVVSGENCVRFSPRYPKHLMQFATTEDLLEHSQKTFWALELEEDHISISGVPALSEGGPETNIRLAKFGLEQAEKDGTLASVGSTWSAENDVVYDGTSRPGMRMVTFAPILKHQLFPLAEILDYLLEIGKKGTSSPVEIEFAVNMNTVDGGSREFGFLQIRPLALAPEVEEVDVDSIPRSDQVCQSTSVLGHGLVEGIRDLVVVDYHRFDRSKSLPAARRVGQLNSMLVKEDRPYILIGVGRWGSADPWLGIPVAWDEISGVRVIVEAGFKDFKVTPSQGTHFFQNLSSCNVGYFTVNPDAGDGYIDWDWLSSTPAVDETDSVRHLRFEEPLLVGMNGKKSAGFICKPKR
ncbi:MAG: histidine kinase [Acidobacteria bacterium]|uniref:Histidine kinase n=1 Tax=Candidatus Polarisedimenticola svalbardensis TaxID=2886004 RepID=A0A8J6XWM9_9BACT|nr:histidine kinase [Candidatus Polarisedimenticola svalbardensis]